MEHLNWQSRQITVRNEYPVTHYYIPTRYETHGKYRDQPSGQLRARPVFVDCDVYSIQAEESPNVDGFVLSIASDSSNRLGLASDVLFLTLGEQWRQEDGVVGNGEISSTSAFIHDVE